MIPSASGTAAVLLLAHLDQAPWVQKHILTGLGSPRMPKPCRHPRSACLGNLFTDVERTSQRKRRDR
jgi:hypothetical protein